MIVVGDGQEVGGRGPGEVEDRSDAGTQGWHTDPLPAKPEGSFARDCHRHERRSRILGVARMCWPVESRWAT